MRLKMEMLLVTSLFRNLDDKNLASDGPKGTMRMWCACHRHTEAQSVLEITTFPGLIINQLNWFIIGLVPWLVRSSTLPTNV